MHCNRRNPSLFLRETSCRPFRCGFYGITKNMVRAGVVLSKRNEGGRPPSGRDPVRTMRLSDDFIDKIDHWASQQEDQPGRSEAVRRLVELGLKTKK
jgi:hypothetical protein